MILLQIKTIVRCKMCVLLSICFVSCDGVYGHEVSLASYVVVLQHLISLSTYSVHDDEPSFDGICATWFVKWLT